MTQSCDSGIREGAIKLHRQETVCVVLNAFTTYDPSQKDAEESQDIRQTTANCHQTKVKENILKRWILVYRTQYVVVTLPSIWSVSYCFTAFTVQPLKDISGGAALRKKKFKY